MNKRNIKAFVFNAFLAAAVLAPLFAGSALAQQGGTTVQCPPGFHPGAGGVCLKDSSGGGPSGWDTLGQAITKVLEYALYFAGIVAVLYIIYGGYLTITAGGSEEQAKKGRTALTHAVTGVILIGLSYMIVRVVSNAVVQGPTN